jgi:thiol-disulfide isomerase/thioredoxin/YHS domain-containing protein
MFRLYQTAFLALISCVFGGCWQTESLAQEISWQTDSDSAIREAANSNKFVLYHFCADWCRPCQHLDTFVFCSPAVIQAVEHHVVPVKVNVDLHPELVKQYGISGIPADVIITPSGRIVKQRSSPNEADGYADMLNQLDRVDRELRAGNKALAQKIDEVLALAKPDTSKVTDHNDFAAKAPSHKQPAPSRDSEEMARKFANHFDVTTGKLTDSESDDVPSFVDMTKPVGAPTQFVPSTASQAPISSGASAESLGTNQETNIESPARVVNNQFFSGNSNSQNSNPESLPKKAAADFKFGNTSIEKSNNNILEPQVPDDRSVRQVNNVTKTDLPQPATGKLLTALHGKCPVSLIQKGKWIDGDPQFGCVHRGKLYLFADRDMLLTFQGDPDAFSPILAGYDPVIFSESGELVEGQEKHGVFMGKLPNQRVILFSSSENRAKFQQDPRRYLSVVQQAVKTSDNLKTR